MAALCGFGSVMKAVTGPRELSGRVGRCQTPGCFTARARWQPLRADCRPARLSSQSCNSRSQPVGAAIHKTNVTTRTGTAKGDPSGVSIVTGNTPVRHAAVAQATAATAFLFTDSLAGSGGRALVSRVGMSR